MRVGLSRRIAAVLTSLAMIFALTLQTAALDDKYRFDDLKMSVKAPKDFYVITRDSDSDDDAFEALGLDYGKTMDEFEESDIYLRAYDPDQKFFISLVVTVTDESKTINNYSDISATDRREILDSIKSEDSVDSAVEVKHNNNIFFDSEGETESDGQPLYYQQSNTVINGMQIDLILQKADKSIQPDESKVLISMANSLEFDKIIRTTGPNFEWWRLLLWAVILVAVALALSFLYRQRNAANHRRLMERRRQRELALAEESGELPEGETVTFEEALGYQDSEQYENRAATDLDTYDIKVEEKDPMQGVALFEDSGESIDDGSDYFDTYFSETVETRKGASRFFGAVWTYIKIGFRRLGYFFRNIKRTIFKKKR